jgi:hypothetical protein
MEHKFEIYFCVVDFAIAVLLMFAFPKYIMVWGVLAFAAPFALIGVLSAYIWIVDHWPTATGNDSRTR